MIDRENLDGVGEVELLMAIEEALPGVHFPETATREDLIRYLKSLDPTGPSDDGDDCLGVGVRNRRPRAPVGGLSTEAEPES